MSLVAASGLTCIVCLLCGVWMGWLVAKGSQNALWPVLVAAVAWFAILYPLLNNEH